MLYQFALISIHGIQAVNHVVSIYMSRRIAQCAQWIHCAERFLTSTLKTTIYALWFINNNNGTCSTNEIDRCFTASLLIVFVEVVYILLLIAPTVTTMT